MILNNARLVILGAGPTGLGAATRAHQLGHKNWLVLETEPTAGGLASSYIDDKGFIWDLGGHVLFSHYKYFDELVSAAVPSWFTHHRESWIWIENSWVPYPFQNNIQKLPTSLVTECMQGLVKVQCNINSMPKAATFQEWIDQRFGEGISRLFLRPYNYKVWGIPPSMMSAQWMGERVAVVDLNRVIRNVLQNVDDVGWGPNATFKFPAEGGTGAIWKSVAARLPQQNMRFGVTVTAVDLDRRILTLSDGTSVEYESLVTTMPLDKLLQLVPGEKYSPLKKRASELVHSSTHVIGIGLEGRPPAHLQGKCWMYFPEGNCLFYRATLFSHYSKNNVPDPEQYWSLMLEVCESQHKPLPPGDIIQHVIDGLVATKLITPSDKIVSRWHKRLEYGYPTPSLDRDAILDEVQPKLEALGVFSRGRFGGWKYEVGNQDHSVMQGVEAVDRIVFGIEESTYFYPDLVNSRKVTTRSYLP